MVAKLPALLSTRGIFGLFLTAFLPPLHSKVIGEGGCTILTQFQYTEGLQTRLSTFILTVVAVASDAIHGETES
jgi:hypothetical protein